MVRGSATLLGRDAVKAPLRKQRPQRRRLDRVVQPSNVVTEGFPAKTSARTGRDQYGRQVTVAELPQRGDRFDPGAVTEVVVNEKTMGKYVRTLCQRDRRGQVGRLHDLAAPA